MVSSISQDITEIVDAFSADFKRVRDAIHRAIVGMDDVVDGTLITLFAAGNVLLEGVPGLGKTMLVRTLSKVVSCDFSRIQFTPDLMPSDITGTNIIEETTEGKRYRFMAGPVFSNIVLADEINRATPKTQSAMLEAMQEQSVTVMGNIRKLDPPFVVLATENPIEMEGTYPLPEAQLDRFFMKLLIHFPSEDELCKIMERTTGELAATLSPVIDRARIIEMQNLVRRVPIAEHVSRFAVRTVLSCHPENDLATPLVRKYVRYGPSPRGVQALILGGKIRALIAGRYNVSADDIRDCAYGALRHRLILNFEAEAEGVDPDAIVEEVLSKVEMPLTEPRTG
ncbi:MoxR family ATPase [bacterium]|nr:MoxR family ATPase [bacterium]